MTSRRSLPPRSSGSRAATLALATAVLLTASSAAPARGDEARASAGAASGTAASPLVERLPGLEIDWTAGTVTASGGAAADLHMPSAELARPGAVRRAELAARQRLGRALSELPLGGDRKLPSDAVGRALGRARAASTDYQSNGGALVRVAVRFVDWLDAPPAESAAAVALTVPSMRLAASPLVKVADGERPLGAAVYRLGPPPADAKVIPAKVDHAGRLIVDVKQAPAVLAGGVALIYVGKVLK